MEPASSLSEDAAILTPFLADFEALPAVEPSFEAVSIEEVVLSL